MMFCYAPPGAAQGLDDSGSDPWAGIEEMVVVGGNTSGLLIEKTTSAIASTPPTSR